MRSYNEVRGRAKYDGMVTNKHTPDVERRRDSIGKQTLMRRTISSITNKGAQKEMQEWNQM